MDYSNFFRVLPVSWRAPLRNGTVDLLLNIGIRSRRQPGISPEGQVRRSASARLGEVRDSSRRMRPPRFLPTGHGGGAMPDPGVTRPDLCSIRAAARRAEPAGAIRGGL